MILGSTHRHFGELGGSLFGEGRRRQSHTGVHLGKVNGSTASAGSKGPRIARAGVGVNVAAMGNSIGIKAGVHAALALAGAVLFVSWARFHPNAAPKRLVIFVFFFRVREPTADIGAGQVQGLGSLCQGLSIEVRLLHRPFSSGRIFLFVYTVLVRELTLVKALSCVVSSLSGSSFCSSTSSVSVIFWTQLRHRCKQSRQSSH